MESDAAPRLAASRTSPGTRQLQLTGAWRIGNAVPAPAVVERRDRIVFDTGGVRGWDSVHVVFAARTMATARTAGVTIDGGGLPSGVRRLLALAEATPPRRVPAPTHASFPLVEATTYGLLIDIAGCVAGLRSGRTAAAVGEAATSAVVAGIVLVIVACGVYAVVFYRLRL